MNQTIHNSSKHSKAFTADIWKLLVEEEADSGIEEWLGHRNHSHFHHSCNFDPSPVQLLWPYLYTFSMNLLNHPYSNQFHPLLSCQIYAYSGVASECQNRLHIHIILNSFSLLRDSANINVDQPLLVSYLSISVLCHLSDYGTTLPFKQIAPTNVDRKLYRCRDARQNGQVS